MRAAFGLVAIGAFAVVAIACGEGAPSGGEDAGIRFDVDASPPTSISPDFEPEPPAPPFEPVVAPLPPESPRLAPCPEGWVPRIDAPDAPVTCTPWSSIADARACGPAEALLPGSSFCVAIGGPCPSGEYAAGLPATRVLFVSASAGEGGDGSAAAPFGRIADALAAATAGDTVAVGRGTFDGPIVIPAGVEVRGACAAETRIVATALGDARGVADMSAAGAVLRRVTVSGEGPGVWVTGAGNDAHLEGVVVEGAKRFGVVAAYDARLTARELLVRNTRLDDGGGTGWGAALEGNGTLEVDRGAFEGGGSIGVLVTSSSAVLRDSAVRDTRGDAGGGRGDGVFVQGGSRVDLVRTVVERNRHTGAICGNEGSRLTLTDVIVRGTTPDGYGGAGRGITIEASCALEATRVVIEDDTDVGLSTSASGPIALADVVVRRTRTSASGELGRGLDVGWGTEIDVARLWVEDSHDAGIFVNGARRFTASDLVVRRTIEDDAYRAAGRGIELLRVPEATIDRALIEDTRENAIAAAETTLEVRDLAVRHTRAAEHGTAPAALRLRDGTTALFERVAIDDSVASAVWIAGGATNAELTDLAIAGVAPSPYDGLGHGVRVEGGAEITIARSIVERVGGTGIAVEGSETMLAGGDVVVRDAAPSAAAGARGHGIFVSNGAAAALSRAVVERTIEGGIVASGGETRLALEDLVVRATRDGRVGALEIVPGRGIGAYDGARVTIERAIVDDNREVGVGAFGTGTRVTLVDAHVSATGERGVGVVAAFGGAIDATRFVARGHESAGAQVAHGGSVLLRTGVVRDNPVGLNVQGGLADPGRLVDDVLFVGNGVDVDASGLPVASSAH